LGADQAEGGAAGVGTGKIEGAFAAAAGAVAGGLVADLCTSGGGRTGPLNPLSGSLARSTGGVVPCSRITTATATTAATSDSEITPRIDTSCLTQHASPKVKHRQLGELTHLTLMRELP
jgi:hypothetical protein